MSAMRARAANPVVRAALVVAEIVGCLVMLSANPVAWMWVGARVYDATGSITADLAVGLAGFTATTILVMMGLVRLDAVWIDGRRRAGHDQREGALTQVVVVAMTVVMVAFYIWFHFLEQAFVIRFMPLE